MTVDENIDVNSNTNQILQEPIAVEQALNLRPQTYDTWKCGDVIRPLEESERLFLDRLRQVYAENEKQTVPNLKAIDKRRVMKEVNLVDCLLHNLITVNMDVTQVNHLFYAGSFVVAEKLGF